MDIENLAKDGADQKIDSDYGSEFAEKENDDTIN